MDTAISFASLGLSALGLFALLLVCLIFSSYVKIVTVLGILRVGLGVGSLPSALVTAGLALALSFFIMLPTMQESAKVVDSYQRAKGNINSDFARAQALALAFGKWKEFLVRHSHSEQRKRFAGLARQIDSADSSPLGNPSAVGQESNKNSALDEQSWRVLAPAFLVSELKEAFATGLSLFLPFLIIDLLVLNVLAAVGLDRMSSASVAFPFKLLLFVMVDGWALITANLVQTYAA